VNIYLICPVRNADFDAAPLVKQWESDGHVVHFPPRDVDQSDPTGFEICRLHRDAMKAAEEVWIIWDVNSKGSHFDLGMAYGLSKRIRLIMCLRPDTEGKSYEKVIRELSL
jgi:hypothetical protein